MMIPKILSIAGSDPSGGAGIQADLKTFSALGCYGMAAITALTAQSTQGVFSVHDVPHHFLAQQIDVLFEDSRIDAVKIGMAGTVGNIGVIAEMIQRHNPNNVVLDTVMVAQGGAPLLEKEAIAALKRELLPLASVITPNIPEAEALLGKNLGDDFNYVQEDMAKALLDLGVSGALLKGGHLSGKMSKDVFVMQGGVLEVFNTPRISTRNAHGTGCTLSSALACYLAKGLEMSMACMAAKKYVTGALQEADSLDIGKGSGPVHHFYNVW